MPASTPPLPLSARSPSLSPVEEVDLTIRRARGDRVAAEINALSDPAARALLLSGLAATRIESTPSRRRSFGDSSSAPLACKDMLLDSIMALSSSKANKQGCACRLLAPTATTQRQTVGIASIAVIRRTRRLHSLTATDSDLQE